MRRQRNRHEVHPESLCHGHRSLLFSLSVARAQESPSVLSAKTQNWPAPAALKAAGTAGFRAEPEADVTAHRVGVLSVRTPALPAPSHRADWSTRGRVGLRGRLRKVSGARRQRNAEFRSGFGAAVPRKSRGAQAYSLNFTVTETQGPGDVRIFPTGDPALVSTQNSRTTGPALANAAFIKRPRDEWIDHGAGRSYGTHLIIDINGYYAPAGVGNFNTFLGLNTGRLRWPQPGRRASDGTRCQLTARVASTAATPAHSIEHHGRRQHRRRRGRAQPERLGLRRYPRREPRPRQQRVGQLQYRGGERALRRRNGGRRRRAGGRRARPYDRIRRIKRGHA